MKVLKVYISMKITCTKYLQKYVSKTKKKNTQFGCLKLNNFFIYIERKKYCQVSRSVALFYRLFKNFFRDQFFFNSRPSIDLLLMVQRHRNLLSWLHSMLYNFYKVDRKFKWAYICSHSDKLPPPIETARRPCVRTHKQETGGYE